MPFCLLHSTNKMLIIKIFRHNSTTYIRNKKCMTVIVPPNIAGKVKRQQKPTRGAML